MSTTLLLRRFRYHDRVRNKWMLARYVCEPAAIRCRYADYELIGAPEVRRVPDDPLALSPAHFARPTTPRPGLIDGKTTNQQAESARRQIDTVVRTLFNGEDVVACATLAGLATPQTVRLPR